jgi:hypothetical protein
VSNKVIKPSARHYQNILRAVVGFPFVAYLYFIRDFGPWEAASELLRNRTLFLEIAELGVVVVLCLAVATGLDRVMAPVLLRLSQKPSLELTPQGIRYLYRNNHADIGFHDIKSVEHADGSMSAIVIRTKTGLVHEIAGYENMACIDQHLRAGIQAGAASEEKFNPALEPTA